jgi:uncharacterized protein (TIGR02646 family)
MHKLAYPQEPIDYSNGVAAFIQDNPQDTRTPAKQWNDFRNEQDEAYKSAREALSKNQGGLCAYCETGLSDNNVQIEHIIPKSESSDTKDYTFDFNNLLLCCKGGTNKNTQIADQLPSNSSGRSIKNNNCSCGQ